MLTTIKDEHQNPVLAFGPTLKLSNSKFFSNQRFLVLLFNHNLLGYFSQLNNISIQNIDPSQLPSICKETIHLPTACSFLISINSQDPCLLNLKWIDVHQKGREWEFKFENSQIAAQWHSEIIKCMVEKPPVEIPSLMTELSECQLTFSSRADITPVALSKDNIEENRSSPDFKKMNQSRFKHRQAEPSIYQNSEIYEKSETKPIDEGVDYMELSRNRKMEQVKNQSLIEQEEKDIEKDVIPAIYTYSQRFSIKKSTFSQNQGQNKSFSLTNQTKIDYNTKWWKSLQSNDLRAAIKINSAFNLHCKSIAFSIINEIAFLKQQRKYIPINKTNFLETYNEEGITLKMHLINQTKAFASKELLIEHCDLHLQSLKQQFYNYDFILSATANSHYFKVPLACVITLYGFVFLCVANPPIDFTLVQSNRKFLFSKKLRELEKLLHLEIIINDLEIYSNRPHTEPHEKDGGTGLIFNLKELIPISQIQGIRSFYLPKSCFLQNKASEKKFDSDRMNYDRKVIDVLEKRIQFLLSECCFEQRSTIISHADLLFELDQHGVPYAYLGQLYKLIDNHYMRRLILTQMTVDSFLQFVRLQLMTLVNQLPLANIVDKQTWQFSTILKDSLHLLISNCLSSHQEAQQMWLFLSNLAYKRYSTLLDQKSILIGYFLGAISLQLGVEINIAQALQLKNNYNFETFTIPQDFIKKQINTPLIVYSLSSMRNTTESSIADIISQTNNYEAFHLLTDVLQLFQEPVLANSSYQCHQIEAFLSCFIQYQCEQPYTHLAIYDDLATSPLQYSIFLTIKSAVKWLLKRDKSTDAFQLVCQFKSLSWFWTSETNPFLAQFYDIFVEYYRGKKNYVQAISYTKLSLGESVKLFDEPSLSCLDKHYTLSELFALNSEHLHSLQELQLVQEMMKNFEMTNTQEYINVVICSAKLTLHLGDIALSVKHLKQAIQFSNMNSLPNELAELELYELLMRALQIDQKYDKMKLNLASAELKFQQTNQGIVFMRLLRLTATVTIHDLQKLKIKKLACALYILEEQEKESVEQWDAKIEMHVKYLMEVRSTVNVCDEMRCCFFEIKKICDCLALRKHSRQKEVYKLKLSEEVEEQAHFLEAVANAVGFEFILGLIKMRLDL